MRTIPTQPILRDKPFFYKDNGVPNQLSPPSSEHQVDAQGLYPAVDIFDDNAKSEVQTTQDCPSSSAASPRLQSLNEASSDDGGTPRGRTLRGGSERGP